MLRGRIRSPEKSHGCYTAVMAPAESEPPSTAERTDADPPTSTGRRLLRLARELLIFAALALVVIGVAGRLRGPDLPPEAPAFALADLEGRTVRLSDYAGRPVVLNFWATWCMPCRVEAPSFDAFARAHPEIPVLGIAADGTPDELRAAADELGISYRILRADRATLRAYGVDVYPTTVIVDRRGRVTVSHAGLMLRPHLWLATRGLAP